MRGFAMTWYNSECAAKVSNQHNLDATLLLFSACCLTNLTSNALLLASSCSQATALGKGYWVHLPVWVWNSWRLIDECCEQIKYSQCINQFNQWRAYHELFCYFFRRSIRTILFNRNISFNHLLHKNCHLRHEKESRSQQMVQRIYQKGP